MSTAKFSKFKAHQNYSTKKEQLSTVFLPKYRHFSSTSSAPSAPEGIGSSADGDAVLVSALPVAGPLIPAPEQHVLQHQQGSGRPRGGGELRQETQGRQGIVLLQSGTYETRNPLMKGRLGFIVRYPLIRETSN